MNNSIEKVSTSHPWPVKLSPRCLNADKKPLQLVMLFLNIILSSNEDIFAVIHQLLLKAWKKKFSTGFPWPTQERGDSYKLGCLHFVCVYNLLFITCRVQLHQVLRGFVVVHCLRRTGIAKVTGMNPFRALIFFRLRFRSLKFNRQLRSARASFISCIWKSRISFE